MLEDSLFSTPSPAFIVCRLFDDGHSDWCEVVSHCSFDLHFSSNGEELKCLLMKVKEASLFSIPSPAFIVCRFFYDGHSDSCKVIPDCNFDFLGVDV